MAIAPKERAARNTDASGRSLTIASAKLAIEANQPPPSPCEQKTEPSSGWSAIEKLTSGLPVTRPEPEIWKIEPVFRYVRISTASASSLGTAASFTPNQIE
jgi:hypothetical protein